MLKFLLHTCCAPCSVAVIEELKDKFNLTVFFYNPNIFPLEEYEKRKAEVVKICSEWGVKMIDMDYEWQKWQEKTRGLENEPEGGKRCPVCFAMRLQRTVEYAKENNFDIFCTTLTSGRNKKAEIINPIGLELAKEFGVEFFVADWKTGGKQQRANQLVKEKGIYRQDYCGCSFSLSSRAKSRDPLK